MKLYKFQGTFEALCFKLKVVNFKKYFLKEYFPFKGVASFNLDDNYNI